jgi:hypothetical protein
LVREGFPRDRTEYAVVVQPDDQAAIARCGTLASVRDQIARYRFLASEPGKAKSDDARLEEASQALFAILAAPCRSSSRSRNGESDAAMALRIRCFDYFSAARSAPKLM